MNFFDECLDREDETQALLNRIYDSYVTQIEFIYASTAVGKSTFTNKVMSLVDTNKFMPICIRTVPENVGNAYAEWEIFNMLFQEINELSMLPHNNITTFNKYLIQDTVLNTIIAKKYVKESIKNPVAIFKNIMQMNLEFLWKTDNYEKIVEDENIQWQYIRKNYLEYIFSTKKILLIIDNIQNIDRASLKNILDILYNTKVQEHYVLFEYTLTSKTSEEQLQVLCNYIKHYNIPTRALPLAQIPREYIIDVVTQALQIIPNSYTFSTEILKYYDRQTTGNLLQIIAHASNIYHNDIVDNTEEEDQILKRLLNLSEKEQLILALIIQNNGKLKRSILEKIIPNDISQQDLNNCFSNLCNEKFIDIFNENELLIHHATTIDSWRQSRHLNIRTSSTLARNIYENYYLNILQNKDIPEEYVASIPWLALLDIYKVKYPEKIYSLIDYLRKGVLTNVSPETAWIFLKAYIDKTQNDIKAYISCYYDILNLCFEFELYEEGFTCITFMEKQITINTEYKLLFYKMLYLSALDRHEENIKEYLTHSLDFPIGSRELLNLMLIAQSSYKSLNYIDECMKIYKHIRKTKVYKSYKEYGYFLRLTCMYLPRKRALRLVRKSYFFFRNKECFHQAGKSAISYAHLLSSLGNPSKGMEYIKKAEILLRDKQIGQHMLLVNKAVISMHMRNFGKEIWDLLDMAEISARVTFDKLAIQICKLVWIIENDISADCQLTINKILNYCQLEPDKAIVSIAYYDLYFYYSLLKEDDVALIYRKEAEKLQNWCPITKGKLNGYVDKEYRFVMKNNWIIFYLEYWTYDLIY